MYSIYCPKGLSINILTVSLIFFLFYIVTWNQSFTVCLVAGAVGWVGSNPHFENGANPSIVWLQL